MTSTLTRQDPVSIRSYDREVTQPLTVDPTAALSMADRAYAVIMDRLIMLDIRPNDPIDDGALAQELGIGRTPVREALKRLETDRLVVAYARRGTFATGVDIADLRHISQIRVNLEPVAARSAAEHASAAVREHLLDLAERTAALNIEN